MRGRALAGPESPTLLRESEDGGLVPTLLLTLRVIAKVAGGSVE